MNESTPPHEPDRPERETADRAVNRSTPPRSERETADRAVNGSTPPRSERDTADWRREGTTPRGTPDGVSREPKFSHQSGDTGRRPAVFDDCWIVELLSEELLLGGVLRASV